MYLVCDHMDQRKSSIQVRPEIHIRLVCLVKTTEMSYFTFDTSDTRSTAGFMDSYLLKCFPVWVHRGYGNFMHKKFVLYILGVAVLFCKLYLLYSFLAARNHDGIYAKLSAVHAFWGSVTSSPIILKSHFHGKDINGGCLAVVDVIKCNLHSPRLQ